MKKKKPLTITCHIFSSERIKNTKKSIIVLPKKKKKTYNSQIEFCFNNDYLPLSHVLIAAQLLLDKWKYELKDYPVYRAFFNKKEGNTIKLFISFNIPSSLSTQKKEKIIKKMHPLLFRTLEQLCEPIKEKEAHITHLTNEIKNQDSLVNELLQTNNSPAQLPTDLRNMIEKKNKWKQKCQLIQQDFNQLENKTISYEEEVKKLNARLLMFEEQLQSKNKTLKETGIKEIVTTDMTTKSKNNFTDDMSIRNLFMAYNPEVTKKITISSQTYKTYLLSFNFLILRWQQALSKNSNSHQNDFFTFYLPFIEGIDFFTEELAQTVKPVFFNKDKVSIDESNWKLLKAYSALSSYLSANATIEATII